MGTYSVVNDIFMEADDIFVLNNIFRSNKELQ